MFAAETEVLHWQGEHPLQRMIHGTFGGEDMTLGDGSIQGLDVSPVLMLCVKFEYPKSGCWF